jgi:hypothetical protein
MGSVGSSSQPSAAQPQGTRAKISGNSPESNHGRYRTFDLTQEENSHCSCIFARCTASLGSSRRFNRLEPKSIHDDRKHATPAGPIPAASRRRQIRTPGYSKGQSGSYDPLPMDSAASQSLIFTGSDRCRQGSSGAVRRTYCRNRIQSVIRAVDEDEGELRLALLFRESG